MVILKYFSTVVLFIRTKRVLRCAHIFLLFRAMWKSYSHIWFYRMPGLFYGSSQCYTKWHQMTDECSNQFHPEQNTILIVRDWTWNKVCVVLGGVLISLTLCNSDRNILILFVNEALYRRVVTVYLFDSCLQSLPLQHSFKKLHLVLCSRQQIAGY